MASLIYIGAGTGNSFQSQQFFDRLLTPPVAARETQYSYLIDGLYASGVWSKLDCLYVFAAFDHGTGLTNLINGNFRATWNVGSGTFTQDRGITPSGASLELTYNCNPSTLVGGNFSQNSASLFGWNLTASSTSGGPLVAQNGSVTARIVFSGGHANWSINHTSTIDAGAIADASGLWITDRSGTTSSSLTRNTVSVQTSSGSSVSLFNGSFVSGSGSNGTSQLAVMGCGASLNVTHQTALYNALGEYLDAVGAI